MRIPLHLPPCPECGKRIYVWINLHDTSSENKCACGNDRSGSLSSDITVGFRALYRSHYELAETKDYPLSMVFSAIAVDWELCRLFCRWTEISALEKGYSLTDKALEKMFRKYRTVFMKFKETGKLMYPQGFEEFIKLSPEFRETVEKGFPSLRLETLFNDFTEKLFWPRNRILHLADTNYGEQDAIRSFNIAQLGLLVLQAMDKYKIDSYDTE